MTLWNPSWKISIAGTDYTNFTLSNLSTNHGRSNIYNQPTASSIQVEIIELDGLPYEFQVNDGIALQVKNSTGTYVSLFGGRISDVTTKVVQSSAQGYTMSYTLIALGSLAKLNRSITDGVLSKAFDGDQIYAILEPLLLNSWNEVPAAETWAIYNATETWANAQNVGLGEIDRPGDYELFARTSSPTDVYSLASQLANSGLGYIYEDNNGLICYADSTHRAQYVSTTGYKYFDANKAIGPGLSTTLKASDVRNSIKLTYKSNAFVTAEDLTSQSLYGQYGSVISTNLENAADATTQANFYLNLRAYPEANLSQITFPITSGELTDAERNNLLGIAMGQSLIISNLPDAITPGGNFTGFVEGWSWRTSYNNLYLTLFLSPFSYSIQSMKWPDVSAAEAWNTLDPALTWTNATIVA